MCTAVVCASLISPGCRDEVAAPRAARPVGAVVWRTALASVGGGGGWQGMPGTDGQRVFIETAVGIAAVDGATGRPLWSAPLWPARFPGTWNLAAAGEAVVFARGDSVYALDTKTGARGWTAAPPGRADFARVLVADTAVYTGTRSNIIYALDARTGRTRWSTPFAGGDWTQGGVLVGFAAAGDTLYALGARFFYPNGYVKTGVVVAVDRSTGHELWRYEAAGQRSDAGSTGAVAGRLLLTSDLYGRSFFAIDRFTGREVWRVPGTGDLFGPSEAPTVVGDTAFVGSNDTFVYAADVRTGRVLWRTKTRASIRSAAPCGRVVAANNQALTLVDRASGRLLGYFLTESDDDPTAGFPTSGVAVVGDRAIVVGTKDVIAVSCR